MGIAKDVGKSIVATDFPKGNHPPVVIDPNADPDLPPNPVPAVAPIPGKETPPAKPPVPASDDFTVPDVTPPGFEDEAAPPPPAAPAADDDTDLPAEVKTQGKGVKDAFIAMRKRIRELESTPPTSAQELEQLRQEREQLQSTLARIDIQQDPQFVAQYEQPRQQVVARLKNLFKKAGVKEEVADSLVSTDDPMARQEIIEDSIPKLAAAVWPMLNQFDGITDARKSAVENAKVSQDKFRSERMGAIAIGKARIYDDTIRELEGSGHFVFKDDEKNKDWNEKVVKPMRDNVRKAFVSGNPIVQARLLAMGVAAPFYLKLLQSESAKRKALEKELLTLRGARPGFRGTSSAPGTPVIPGRMDAEAAASAAASRLARR